MMSPTRKCQDARFPKLLVMVVAAESGRDISYSRVETSCSLLQSHGPAFRVSGIVLKLVQCEQDVQGERTATQGLIAQEGHNSTIVVYKQYEELGVWQGHQEQISSMHASAKASSATLNNRFKASA